MRSPEILVSPEELIQIIHRGIYRRADDRRGVGVRGRACSLSNFVSDCWPGSANTEIASPKAFAPANFFPGDCWRGRILEQRLRLAFTKSHGLADNCKSRNKIVLDITACLAMTDLDHGKRRDHRHHFGISGQSTQILIVEGPALMLARDRENEIPVFRPIMR
jgi:hypothetical protein